MRQLIECLESRRLLAGAAGAAGGPGAVVSLNAEGNSVQFTRVWSSDQFHVTKRGTLVIRGTDGADALAVARQGGGGGGVSVRTDPRDHRVTMNFTDPSIRRVLIEAGGGADVIDVSGFDRPATVAGGTGDDRLWAGRGHQLIGGGGNDVLVATAAWHLPDAGEDAMVGDPVDPRPSLLSGGAGRDTLVAAPGLADSLIGGAGSDRLVATITYPAQPPAPPAQPPTGATALELLIEQDAVTLSGLEQVQISERRATTEVPADGVTYNSPFGMLGSVGAR